MKNFIIKLPEVSNFLGVSGATVRNWIKCGYLTPIKKKKEFLFKIKEIQDLKRKITNGEIKRLNNRANKSISDKTFIPREYHDSKYFLQFSEIVNYIQNKNIERERALFLLAIKQLSQDKLITSFGTKNIHIKDISFKHDGIKKVILEWYLELSSFIPNEDELHLLTFYIPLVDDFLGVIYQSLLLEGEKASLGSYYTPKNIISDFSESYIQENMKILDPCCGTGQFLITLADKIKNPLNIYGYDIDRIPVRICQINIAIKFKDKNFYPRIYNLDALVDTLPNQKFDLIATNPPWGYHFREEELKKLGNLYPEIVSKESFSFFLRKAICLLSSEGIVSFILPESILNVSVHKDIRKYLLENTCIHKIIFLDRVFKNVFTKVIRIDLKKGSLQDCNKIKIILENKDYEISQKRFLENRDFVFNIFSNDVDERIISKVYSTKFKTLKDNADWALGIVTGNNEKYVSSKMGKGYEPVITGKEVSRFKLLNPVSFIKFEPEKFQQVAPIDKYRVKEKLIYRFISDKPIFSFDNAGLLTLNSANILIPKIPDYPIKVILAFLNSKVYQFIYKKKFNSIKILRGHIEELPFPILDKITQKEIISLVDRVLEGGEQEELNNKIFMIFNFSDEEKEYVLKQN